VTPTPSARRPAWRGLGAKLFASYLLVVLVGLVVLVLAADVAAPRFFGRHLAGMPGPGMGRMMAPGGGAALDTALQAAFQTALQQALLLSAAAGAGAAAGASLFVTGRLLGPLRSLAAASQRIAGGRYAERVSTAGDDELGDLARSFNSMAAALEETERRRLALIGDVAHELRTPLATLQGNLEGLLDGVVKPEPATWARLHVEAGRLRRLVEDLQELSRAEAGRIRLEPRAVDPAGLVAAAVAPLADAFAEKGIALATELAPDLPSVRADPDRAVQVLTNLLTNALRYTPAPGTVRVTARRAAGGVELAVADSGVGLAPEHLERVFERFYRVDRSRSRAPGAPWAGSGVGLTIARALVEAMGGRIHAESPGPGRGATFRVVLPIAGYGKDPDARTAQPGDDGLGRPAA
jgi:signal transduction histidine kinase